MHLDAREKPPDYLRLKFKRYRGVTEQALSTDNGILDVKRSDRGTRINQSYCMHFGHLRAAFRHFCLGHGNPWPSISRKPSIRYDDLPLVDGKAYEVDDMPGLIVTPQLLPASVQEDLLNRLLHRDLSDPAHRTNVHLHHDLHYPQHGLSFFDNQPSTSPQALPKDPVVHKPISISQLLNKKLRWMTLGGQYDWTKKEYPSEEAPPFPPDVSELLQDLFPQTTPEAAIVNVYSPGDTLSMHRDVSEESEQPLISISIGCDALFLIGLDPSPGEAEGQHTIIHLRSGDALYMAGPSRFAWHGVPAIIPNTCPERLQCWPAPYVSTNEAHGAQYEPWRDWLASKRINLNVRQMRADT